MADLMQFNQNTNDAPNFSSAFINKKMNTDVANLKKRKLLPEVADELGLPEPKHKCYESVIVDSENDTSSLTAMVTEDVHTWVDSEPDISSVLDTQVESTEDSNSFPGDTHSANVDIKVDPSFKNTDSYDEASTSWDTTGLRRLRNNSIYGESTIGKDDKENERYLNQDTAWHDIDGLEECISEQYCKDSSGETTEGLHELLSSSVVDPNILAFSSEKWDGEQETQPERRKPTIDQEFEQYFSTLML